MAPKEPGQQYEEVLEEQRRRRRLRDRSGRPPIDNTEKSKGRDSREITDQPAIALEDLRKSGVVEAIGIGAGIGVGVFIADKIIGGILCLTPAAPVGVAILVIPP